MQLFLFFVCNAMAPAGAALSLPRPPPSQGASGSTRRAAMAKLAGGVAGASCWVATHVRAEEPQEQPPAQEQPAPAQEQPPPAQDQPPPAESKLPPAPREATLFDFDVPFRGEPTEIAPFVGKGATIVVNIKYDDPEAVKQLPALQELVSRYSSQGLSVLAFPTDQGWFEADDSNTLRLKLKSFYGFGQFPSAVCFDKADLLGANSLPLYGWLTAALPNPWGVKRLVFNFERFLLDGRGVPLRRYPRRYPTEQMDADVRALLAGEPLPPAPAALERAWEDAKRESQKSEYAFKAGLNYYQFGSPAS